MKDSFGEIYGEHYSACIDFCEKWIISTAKFLAWGSAIVTGLFFIISTWEKLDWWILFRAIAAVLSGILIGAYIFVLVWLMLISIGITGFILMLIGCLISSSIVYFNQPDPYASTVHSQANATAAASQPSGPTSTSSVPASSTSPAGSSPSSTQQVQKIVDDAQQILNGIDIDIQSAAMQLKIIWPKAADTFIASIDVNDLAKKNIQVSHDLKDQAITVARLDAQKLQIAADEWTHAKSLLRGIRTELDQISAEPFEYTDLSNHIEAFHNAIKVNLEKREWTHNQAVISGIHGLIKEMSPFHKEARTLGFLSLDEVNQRDLTVKYRHLAMMTHPDQNPSPDAHEMFARVGRAHKRLKTYLTQKGNSA